MVILCSKSDGTKVFGFFLVGVKSSWLRCNVVENYIYPFYKNIFIYYIKYLYFYIF